jgi:CO/xanthine dehydrogenase FAD-binding subunit
MKPPHFDYYRATSVAEAVALLARHGPDAKALAGGQSLLPLMKLRLARPGVLVDLNRIAELAYIRRANGTVACGAMARLSELESAEIRSLCPILAAAARHIGHPPIRHRGTICGSLAHADPAAELPLLALALDAEFSVTGAAGERVVQARDFFITYLTTSLGPGELLVEARFPVLGPRTGWGFQELSRRHGDFAIVAAAAVIEVASAGTIGKARIALGAVADRPIRCPEAEAALIGTRGEPQAFEAAARAAAAPLEPPGDVHGSSAYRRHLATVLVERALAEAWQRAPTG